MYRPGEQFGPVKDYIHTQHHSSDGFLCAFVTARIELPAGTAWVNVWSNRTKTGTLRATPFAHEVTPRAGHRFGDTAAAAQLLDGDGFPAWTPVSEVLASQQRLAESLTHGTHHCWPCKAVFIAPEPARQICPSCHRRVSKGAPPGLAPPARGRVDRHRARQPGATDDEEADLVEEGDGADWDDQSASFVWRWGSMGSLPFDPREHAVAQVNMFDIAGVSWSNHDELYRQGSSNQLPVVTFVGINSTRVVLFHGHPTLLSCPDTAICTSVDERAVHGSLTGWEIDDRLKRSVENAEDWRTWIE